jgi:polyferredoxin
LYPIITVGFNKTDLFLTADSKNEPANMMLIMYLIIFGIFGLITFFAGKRALCKYLCPSATLFKIGMFLKKLLPFPTLRLLAIKEKCSSCGICNKVCPMNLDVKGFVQIGKFDQGACILCGECLASCPKGALKRGLGK